jgi:hypothetical protein
MEFQTTSFELSRNPHLEPRNRYKVKKDVCMPCFS